MHCIIIHVVPREAIESIWLSFNIHGEGWGLDWLQLKEIFANAQYMAESIGKSAL
jgi:hypothetical protein